MGTFNLYSYYSKCTRCCDKGVECHPCILKKDCDLCNSLTSDQTSQLANPTYKAHRDKKTATPRQPVTYPGEMPVAQPT